MQIMLEVYLANPVFGYKNLLGEILEQMAASKPAAVPIRRTLTVDGAKVSVARFESEIVVSVKRTLAASFAWGAPVEPIATPIGELRGLLLYAGPWPELDPRPWLAEPSNQSLLGGLELGRGESLLVASNLLSLRGRAGSGGWHRRAEAILG